MEYTKELVVELLKCRDDINHFCTYCQSSKLIGETLHKLLFESNQSILVAGDKVVTATDWLAELRLAYRRIPKWITPGIRYDSKTEIEFDTRSRIKAVALTHNSWRGRSVNRVVFLNAEEWTHKQNEQAQDAIYCTMCTNGTIVYN